MTDTVDLVDEMHKLADRMRRVLGEVERSEAGAITRAHRYCTDLDNLALIAKWGR